MIETYKEYLDEMDARLRRETEGHPYDLLSSASRDALSSATLVNEDIMKQEAPYDMANLYPANTGLPMTVWVSVKNGARHDVRVKVNRSNGPTMDHHNTASVALRPKIEVKEGSLTAQQEKVMAKWMTLNAQALVDLWDGRIDFFGFASVMQRI